MPDFLPSSENELKTWCTNFSTKIVSLGASVDLTPAEITDLVAKCGAINGRIDDKAAKKSAWLASVAACSTGNAADLAAIRAAVALIKPNSGYSESTGQDLGVIGGASVLDAGTYKGELNSAEQTGPNQVTVKFGKARGKVDGVNVYMRLQGQSEWKFLARDTVSPYVDTTPLAAAGKPEVREYRIRAVLNDEEIGDYSDVVQVTVT